MQSLSDMASQRPEAGYELNRNKLWKSVARKEYVVLQCLTKWTFANNCCLLLLYILNAWPQSVPMEITWNHIVCFVPRWRHIQMLTYGPNAWVGDTPHSENIRLANICKQQCIGPFAVRLQIWITAGWKTNSARCRFLRILWRLLRDC